MPEILPDHVPSPRTPLVWDGTAYRAVRSHTDGTLQVRGEDQVFSYKEELYLRQFTANAPGADTTFDFPAPPVGELWVITNTSIVNATTAYTRANFMVRDGVIGYDYYGKLAPAIDEMVNWQGKIPIENDRHVRITTIGSLAGDAIYSFIHGYKMTLEV